MAFLVLLLFLFPLQFCESRDVCTAVIPLDTRQCSHESFLESAGWHSSICTSEININVTSSSCAKKNTCGKELRVSVIDQQLFAVTMKNTFDEMLSRCCRNCAQCSIVNEVEDTTLITEEVLRTSDVIFPVLFNSNVQKLNGFFALPVYDVPSFFYFTLRKSNNKVMKDIIIACYGLWPFLLICMMFAVISGFIVWLIEHRGNSEEFPPRYFAGIFNGFWWSFISMTTVGFGDRVTKTYVGKVFAVIWILVGITMSSMFTASLTSEIISAREPAATTLSGRRVGVLKERLHDIALVTEQGGIVRSGSIGNTMRGIDELLTMLENGTIDGMLLDRNTYYHFNVRMHEPKYSYIANRLKPMSKTEKVLSRETLSCGFLVKEYDDYSYFKSYIDSSILNLRSCNGMRMNRKESQVENDMRLFDPAGGLFLSVLYYSIGIVAVIITAGFVVEGRRYYTGSKDKSQV